MPADDAILPTILFPYRKSAEEENKKHFRKLPGETVTFNCQDGGNLSYKRWLYDAQGGLVNGSRGVVTGYVSTATLEREHGANLGFDTGREGTLDPRQKRWLSKHPQLPEVKFADGRTRVIPPNVWEFVIPSKRKEDQSKKPETEGALSQDLAETSVELYM
eukprot:jgi/Mesen1/911/ME001169S00144